MGKKTDLKDSCAYCGQTNCIDLFRHTENQDHLVGGELYLYKQMTHQRVEKDELSTHVCSNGRLLQCTCFIVGTLGQLYPDSYVITVCGEIVRDIKASFYLAMSGYYRQAILIQRCVWENFLYGLYFDTEHYVAAKRRSDTEQQPIYNTFKSWLDGGYRKPNTYLTDIIQRNGFISKEQKKEWDILYDELSRFVHTIRETQTGQAFRYGNIEIKGCYSEVHYDKEALAKWSDYYQRLIFIILWELIFLYPEVKKEEAGKLAIHKLRAEFRGAKQRMEDPYLKLLLKTRIPKATNN